MLAGNAKVTNSKMQGTAMGQSKNWCFTFFATEQDTIDDFLGRCYSAVEIERTIIASIACGLETCPKTKREHVQGFLQTYTKRMFHNVAEVAV